MLKPCLSASSTACCPHSWLGRTDADQNTRTVLLPEQQCSSLAQARSICRSFTNTDAQLLPSVWCRWAPDFRFLEVLQVVWAAGMENQQPRVLPSCWPCLVLWDLLLLLTHTVVCFCLDKTSLFTGDFFCWTLSRAESCLDFLCSSPPLSDELISASQTFGVQASA